MNRKQKSLKKRQLIKLYGCFCFWCGECLPQDKLTIDHLNPSSRGGSDSLENLRLACLNCNRERGNSLFPPRWRKGCCV